MNKRLLFLFLLLLHAPITNALEVTSDEECLVLLRSRLGSHSDFVSRSLKRIGDQTVELEVSIVSEGDFDVARTVFADFSRYEAWVLRKINQKPRGGSYLLQIKTLKTDPNDKNILISDLAFELPLLSREFQRVFRLSAKTKGRAFTMTGETIRGEKTIIGQADGFMKVFPTENKPNRLWIYVKGRAKINNWLVYEALPDKVLARESGERIRIVMDNYLIEEDRIKAMSQIESNPQRKKGNAGRVGVSSEPNTSRR